MRQFANAFNKYLLQGGNMRYQALDENCISADIHFLFILLNITLFALFLVSSLLDLPLLLLTTADLHG